MVGVFVADVVSAKDMREFILPDFNAPRIPQWAARAEYFPHHYHVDRCWQFRSQVTTRPASRVPISFLIRYPGPVAPGFWTNRFPRENWLNQTMACACPR